MEEIKLATAPQTRKNYINYLKVLAILAVIVIHVLGDLYYYKLPQGRLWYMVLFGASLVRFGVPIFIMCSGAINLNEDKAFSIKKSLTLVFKYLIIFAIWTFLYLNVDYFISFKHVDYNIYIAQNVHHFKYHLWYLPTLIFLYIITPALKLITKKENKNQIAYLLLVFLSTCLVVSLSNYFYDCEILTFVKTIVNNDIISFALIYILGWYLSTIEIPYKYQKLILWGGLAAYLSSPALNILLSYLSSTKMFPTSNHLDILTIVSSCGLFLLFKNHEEKLPQSKFINLVAKNTLYIYLVHVAIILVLQKYVIKDMYLLYSSILIYIAETIFVFVVSLLFSIAITHINNKIKSKLSRTFDIKTSKTEK